MNALHGVKKKKWTHGLALIGLSRHDYLKNAQCIQNQQSNSIGVKKSNCVENTHLHLLNAKEMDR